MTKPQPKPKRGNPLTESRIRTIVREELGLIEQIKAAKFKGPTDAEVEELAKVLCREWKGDGWRETPWRNDWRSLARAAHAHLTTARAEQAERERDLYREGYEAFMVRPGHDRQRTCYEGDGWDRIRAAVKAIEDYADSAGALTRAKEAP